VNEIRAAVRNFVLDNFMLEVDPAAFTDDTDLRESRILDSLAILRLITFVEDEFQIQLELEDLESGNLLSLASIEKLVLSRAAQHS
jgi:methoxymalonate biosynthesis acyl carrier protein